jgi:hypothetical protein
MDLWPRGHLSWEVGQGHPDSTKHTSILGSIFVGGSHQFDRSHQPILVLRVNVGFAFNA